MEEPILSKPVQTTNTDKNPLSSLEPDWYQNDLSHMTTNLMKNAINTTTALNPNIMLASASFNEDVYGGYNPGNWGNVDLGGLGNFYGSGDYRNKPNVIRIEKQRAKDSSKDIFHNVFNRDPNAKEWDNAAGSVYGFTEKDFNKRYNALQKKLANSKEGHDRIANIGIDVLGYVPSEELIKQEQAKLAKYGTTQQDIRNNLANSQAAYNHIHDNANRIFGYDWGGNADNVHWAQGRLQKEGMQAVLDSLAYSDETYNHIRDSANRIFGYDWGSGNTVNNVNNVRWAQGHLQKEGMQAVLDSFVYEDETHNKIQIELSAIYGAPINEETTRFYQVSLANGWLKNIEDVKNSFINSPQVHDKIVEMGNKNGMTLTPKAIEDQKELIKKYGFVKTQQTFNQVADDAKIIKDEIPGYKSNADYFAKYQKNEDNRNKARLEMLSDYGAYRETDPNLTYVYDYSQISNVWERYAIFVNRYGIDVATDVGGDEVINSLILKIPFFGDKLTYQGKDIGSDSARFAIAGGIGIDRDGLALSFYQNFVEKPNLENPNPEPEKHTDGTQSNAARHVLWSMGMTNYRNINLAKEAADIHETNPHANLEQRVFDNWKDADEVTDLLNNEIGRDLGSRYSSKQDMKLLASDMIDEFYKNGFYTFKQRPDGKHEITRTKINKEQHDHMKNEYINNLDSHGFKK